MHLIKGGVSKNLSFTSKKKIIFWGVCPAPTYRFVESCDMSVLSLNRHTSQNERTISKKVFFTHGII